MNGQQPAEFFRVSTEGPPAVIEAAPAPVVTPPAHSHEHLVFPNLLDTFRSLLSIIVFALFVMTFIAQPFRIPSESMERTLLVGDFLLVNKFVLGPPGHWSWLLPYEPVHRGDIVVFHFPLDPSDHVVKRVVGVPGDRIRLQNGVVFVNGVKQNEPYVVFENAPQDSYRDQFPARLYTDPGVDTHWWLQMRNDVRDGELVVPSGFTSSWETIATTAATAAIGVSFLAPILSGCLCSSTSHSRSLPRPMPTRCRMINSDTRRAHSIP